jgi:hypothetical protein
MPGHRHSAPKAMPTAMAAPDQAVAQFDQVRDEGRFGAGQFVLGVFFGSLTRRRLPAFRPGGRKRATRAAPDCALVRTPLRCLYHCGVAPRLRRQFFFGGLYSGAGVASGSLVGRATGVAEARCPADQWPCPGVESKALAWTSCTVCSTSRAASSNCGLHLLELVELDGAVDLGLDVGHVALRLAQHVAHRARHARQLLGPMTISATAPMSASLSKPKSIMQRGGPRRKGCGGLGGSGLGLGLDVDGVGVGVALRW